jgi:N-acetylglucosaminyl-diphospho-decaprenol L-rhamnosyltransferase
MGRAHVDVGVVTYNTRELTVHALRRLLDTDQGCDLTLYVRDNGSLDGTADAIRAEVPEAHLDAGAENLGFAAGVNRLLARSTAPWFLALNSDAWPEPGAIGALVDAAGRHPEAAAVAPRIERPDGMLEHSTHPFPSLRVACLVASGLQGLLPSRSRASMMLEGAWLHDRPRQVDWAVGAALLMRRDAVLDVGGFDEWFFMYAEDLEWCWRAHRHGWSVWFEPESLVRHEGNASGAGAYGSARTAAYLHNTYRFYDREHGWLAARAYRAVNVLGCLRVWLLAVVRGDSDRSSYWRRMAAAHLRAPHGSDRPRTVTSR